MNGTTVVPKDVIDSIKGKDTTLVLDMGNGLSWKINGQDITDAAGDIDFDVTVGADAGKSIPVDVINNVTGERYSMNLTLAYDGEFGFTATLTVNMESKNAGLLRTCSTTMNRPENWNLSVPDRLMRMVMWNLNLPTHQITRLLLMPRL